MNKYEWQANNNVIRTFKCHLFVLLLLLFAYMRSCQKCSIDCLLAFWTNWKKDRSDAETIQKMSYPTNICFNKHNRAYFYMVWYIFFLLFLQHSGLNMHFRLTDFVWKSKLLLIFQWLVLFERVFWHVRLKTKEKPKKGNFL